MAWLAALPVRATGYANIIPLSQNYVLRCMNKLKRTFKDLQKDIERYLTSISKREKRSDGMVVFRGYNDALQLMFEKYLRKDALEPLAKHLRSWSWEHSYNDFLDKPTLSLKHTEDWLEISWGVG
ncbi:hypothetical protein BVY02_01550 [bacterium J17]|nr:hypothetical protein BVY02_01550 [bacterium J17]